MRNYAQFISDSWWLKRPILLNYLLLPWSMIFASIATIRRWLYELGLKKPYKAPVPLVVIGNIVVGGTGKTPLVIHLVNYLKEQGYKPGIVSRGYGGKNIKTPTTVTKESVPSEVGDEPTLIVQETNVPMVVAINRPAAVKKLLAEHDCDVIISDDGLQHYAMARDMEIIVVDGERCFGNRFCLPAGPLREPLSRLSNFDFIVLNGHASADHCGSISRTITMQFLPGQLTSIKDSNKKLTVEELMSQQIHAVAGIGNPSKFFKMLKKMGLNITKHPFSDHHTYTPQDINFDDNHIVIMTGKDAVKCKAFADERHYYLPITVSIEPYFLQKFITQLGHIKKEKTK